MNYKIGEGKGKMIINDYEDETDDDKYEVRR